MDKRLLALALSVLTVVLATATSASAAVPDNWSRWLADAPDTTIRSLDFIGPDLFAAGESNGVFNSGAAHGPWSQQTSGLDDPTKQSVHQIKVSPSGELYACTSAGLFKRPAAGGSWTPVG